MEIQTDKGKRWRSRREATYARTILRAPESDATLHVSVAAPRTSFLQQSVPHSLPKQTVGSPRSGFVLHVAVRTPVAPLERRLAMATGAGR